MQEIAVSFFWGGGGCRRRVRGAFGGGQGVEKEHAHSNPRHNLSWFTNSSLATALISVLEFYDLN